MLLYRCLTLCRVRPSRRLLLLHHWILTGSTDLRDASRLLPAHPHRLNALNALLLKRHLRRLPLWTLWLRLPLLTLLLGGLLLLLLALESTLLFRLGLLWCLLWCLPCSLLSLLLPRGPALLLELLPELLLLSLFLGSRLLARLRLSAAPLFAHKLTHLASRRLIAFLGAAC